MSRPGLQVVTRYSLRHTRIWIRTNSMSMLACQYS